MSEAPGHPHLRVLAIGGSGVVGHLVLPQLARRHWIRVFDLNPPGDGAAEFFIGGVSDAAALRQASRGMDVVLYMAAGRDRRDNRDHWETDAAHTAAFDVNVRGVHLALRAAQQVGVMHAVYASSMSVYDAIDSLTTNPLYFADEDLPPDAGKIYGFTKRLGEEVCRTACRAWGMSVNVLRLCHPLADTDWYEETRDGQATIAIAASDLARALDAAFIYRAGFQAFTISGDYTERWMSLAKAKERLGWEPLARPCSAAAEEQHGQARSSAACPSRSAGQRLSARRVVALLKSYAARLSRG